MRHLRAQRVAHVFEPAASTTFQSAAWSLVALWAVCLFSVFPGRGATLYVDVKNPNPSPPFASWATAARAIQDAVDASVAADEILVTNGVYSTGGRPAFGALTNRVAIDKSIHVRSVNGAANTIIEGYQVPGTTNGDAAVRCVYLADGASLTGFTLRGGATRTVVNDYATEPREATGGGVWCESTAGVLSNCVVIANCADSSGGGAYGGTLYHCVVSGNYAGKGGGGAADCALNACWLTNNVSGGNGGGAAYAFWPRDCLLDNCLVTGNKAVWGGGAFGCLLTNCTVVSNVAQSAGGVAGGGVIQVQFYSELFNCIVYSNLAPTSPNYDDGGCYLDHCCTEPAPQYWYGPGNITNNPLFVDLVAGDLHLLPNSPCINAGDNSSSPSTTDLDGLSRIAYSGLVDMGAYEFHGVPIVHYVDVNSANPVPPYSARSTAALTIQDAIDAALSGDTILVADGIYASGGRAITGLMTNRATIDKPLTLMSINGPASTIIQGCQDPATTNGDGAIRCVYMINGASLSGFTLRGGATRADQTGGGLFFDDPYFGLSRPCVSNCWLIGNSAPWGGAAHLGWFINCRFMSNSPTRGATVYIARLDNCVLLGNASDGAYGGTLNNCTVVANLGVGAYGYHSGMSGDGCALNNCIVYYNLMNFNPYSPFYSMNNCCTFNGNGWWDDGIQSWGSGNITNEPVFVDLAGGDLRLQPGSPCINAGNNQWAPPGQDLAEAPRIVGGTVDIGAYEFQGATGLSFPGWLQYYGLPNDGSADYADPDHDGMNNWSEWISGTNPTNASSVFRLLSPGRTSDGIVLRWKGGLGINYLVERTVGIGSPDGFLVLATNIQCQSTTDFPLDGLGTFTDTSATDSVGVFYRVSARHL